MSVLPTVVRVYDPGPDQKVQRDRAARRLHGGGGHQVKELKKYL